MRLSNRPRELPWRTKARRSVPNRALKIASGPGCASAPATAPASMRPSAGPLLAHEGHVRPAGGQQLLEPLHGGLTVFVVGCDRHVGLGRQRRGGLHQHGGLHEGGGADPPGIAVALGPGQRIGQRLPGHVQLLGLQGVGADCQADIGQVAAGQQIHLLVVDQLGRQPHGVLRRAAIVTGDDLELAAVHPNPNRSRGPAPVPNLCGRAR